MQNIIYLWGGGWAWYRKYYQSFYMLSYTPYTE